MEFAIIPTAMLRLSEDNARQDGPGDVSDLVASIKVHGVLVPIHVIARSGFYEVLDGQRRMTAAKEIGVEAVPAIVYQEDEVERSAELGVAINVVRSQLSAINIAKAAGHVLMRAGLDLGSVSALAIAKKGADKLRKMPAVVEAAAGCGVDIDTFITYGALSSLEPEWWDALTRGRTQVGTLGMALHFTPEERAAAMTAAKGGWIDSRQLWAQREKQATAVTMSRALFSKKSGIEEHSDLFGANGFITPGSVSLFFERQEAAAHEVAAAIAQQLAEILGTTVSVPVAYGSDPYRGGYDVRYLDKKNATPEAIAEMIERGGLAGTTGHQILICERTGEVTFRFKRPSTRSGRSEEPQHLTSAAVDELAMWAGRMILRAASIEPAPIFRLFGLAHVDKMSWKTQETFSGYGNGYAYPLARKYGYSAEGTLATGEGTAASFAAQALCTRLAMHVKDKPDGFTRGVRYLLAAYHIDPADVGQFQPSPTFLKALSKETLEDLAKRANVTGKTKGKLASALADKLPEDWWPAELDGFRPQEGIDDLLSNQDEENEDGVAEAARPEVPADYAGDPPGSAPGEAQLTEDDEWDGFEEDL